MKIREILKSSSKISVANVIGGAMAAAANIVVARRLGPEKLGVIGLVQLWLLYAGFARPGLLQAGYREILHLTGQGDETSGLRVENLALTAETTWLVLPVGAMLIAGLHNSDVTLRAAMFIAALTFVFNSLYQFADTLQWAHQRFDLIARVNFFINLAQPALTLAGLFAFGLFGVLFAPAAASAAAFALYVASGAVSRFRPTWDRKEAVRLLKIGVPLSLYGFLYWGFRTSDRAMVASWLSLKDLGYFTFAMTLIAQGCQLVSDFLNVFQANLFSELGKTGRVRPLSSKLQRMSLLILLVTGAAAGVAECFFRPAAALLVPKFVAAAPVFEILALNIVCTTAPLLAYSVLVSAVVDRQKASAAIQAGGLVLNVAAGWALVKLGWGLSGIAWSSALSQLAVAAAAYGLLHGLLFEGAPRREAARFYGWAGALLAAAFGLHALMSRGPFAFGPESSLVKVTVLRAALTGGVWLTAAAALYRRWWAPLHFAWAASERPEQEMAEPIP